MDVVPYDPDWLPQLAALARAHARLTLPGWAPSDEAVAVGIERHMYWPFYTPGMRAGQVLLVVRKNELLAAAQAGYVGHGWGYGAAWGDGPDWLYEPHLSLFWLLCWPAGREAAQAAALLAAHVVGAARAEGLPGVEAFRGGPGFFPFGSQLSSRWPHLWEPLRAAGFRQPRDMLVYSGETTPDALPLLGAPPNMEIHTARGRLEAWLDGEPVGVCAAEALRAALFDRPQSPDERATTWAVIRRLVVNADVRGQGIGSALFAAQLRRLHRRGAQRYLLHIPDSPEDAAARALYAKFGRLVDRQHVLRVSF